jgi:hypothetical protein
MGEDVSGVGGEVHTCAETLRADRLEDALRQRERQLARLVQMADSWTKDFGERGIKATLAAEAIRMTIRSMAR